MLCRSSFTNTKIASIIMPGNRNCLTSSSSSLQYKRKVVPLLKYISIMLLKYMEEWRHRSKISNLDTRQKRPGCFDLRKRLPSTHRMAQEPIWMPWSRAKSLVPVGNRTQVIQLVARRSTDRAIEAPGSFPRRIKNLKSC